MLILGIIPKREKKPLKFIIEAAETELDKVSGIADTAHIEGRIKVGHEITPSAIYDKLEYFAKNQKELAQIAPRLRALAENIENLLPKE